MAKLSIFVALCFFFCLASAQLDPNGLMVEFDASLFAPGVNVSTWDNTGLLGGSVTLTTGTAPAASAVCGTSGASIIFNGEAFSGAVATPITFSASDAAVVVVVASATPGTSGGIITTGSTNPGPGGETEIGPGAFYEVNYVQDGESPSAGNNVNFFSAPVAGTSVAFAFVYETPIGTTANDFWITADSSGTNVAGLGTNVQTTINTLHIGDRLGSTGFTGCIHYLAIYQVTATPVNDDAISTTLLDLATRFNIPTNTTTSPSPVPGTTGTTGSTTGSSTTGSTTGSRTTGRRGTTHMSSAALPAVHTLLFAAIVSMFLFFLW